MLPDRFLIDPASAAAFHLLRRRVQQVLDRRFNRRCHDADRIIRGLGCVTWST